jgi:hypothetical protein
MHEKKIAHRDLKPDNILVSSTYHCKLVSITLYSIFFRRILEIRKSLTKKMSQMNSHRLPKKKIEIHFSRRRRLKMGVFRGAHLLERRFMLRQKCLTKTEVVHQAICGHLDASYSNYELDKYLLMDSLITKCFKKSPTDNLTSPTILSLRLLT